MGERSPQDLIVAIVDDDRDLRTTLVRGLEKFGVICRPFASGEDLLEALSYFEPDCILLDLRMPGMDGMKVMSLIPAEKRHIPVLVLTSHGDIPTAVKAVKIGAQDFLEKPIKIEQIYARIREFTELSEHRRLQADQAIQARHLFDTLTQREDQVIRMACKGLRNLDIAEKLGLSIRTVENHRRNAGLKLGSNRIATLISLVKAADSIG